MSVTIANSLFIVSSLKRYAGFYQRLFETTFSFKELGNKLITIAEQEQAFRRYDKVKEAAICLVNLPLKEYQGVGHYYLGLCEYRRGHNEQSQKLLEQASSLSVHFQDKAILSLAAVALANNNIEESLYYYLESIKASRDLPTMIQARRGLAVLKAIAGQHRASVSDLEHLYPVARLSRSVEYFDYLNSLAVELGEVGRIQEAQNVCRITLASPYAFAYREWRETEQDLALRGYKSRSSVRVKAIPGNLLYLPEREASDTSIQLEVSQPRPVSSLQKWKEEKMVKEPNGDDKIDTKRMSERELILKIIELSSNENITEEELREILDAVVKITSKHR